MPEVQLITSHKLSGRIIESQNILSWMEPTRITRPTPCSSQNFQRSRYSWVYISGTKFDL